MSSDLVLSKSLDLNGHDAKNFYPHRMAADPTGLTSAHKGLMWFNTTENAAKYWTGAQKVVIGGAPDLSAYYTKTESNALLAAKADLTAGKVPLTQIPDSVFGGLDFKGTWNASSNTPNLVTTPPSDAGYYKVTTAGSTSLGGITDWAIGDWAIWTGSAWDKVDNSEAGGAVPSATETVEGKAELATQAEANAGTDNSRIMTPLKTRVAGDARYVRTVNSIAPDSSGNVTVATGGGGGGGSATYASLVKFGAV